MASFDEAPPGNPKAGEKIFRTKCAQCHTVDKGAGHKQGPSSPLYLILWDHHFSILISIILSLFRSGSINVKLGWKQDQTWTDCLGGKSGTTPGYSYSAANKNMAVMWEEKTLYDYLLNPKKVLFFYLFISIYSKGSLFFGEWIEDLALFLHGLMLFLFS